MSDLRDHRDHAAGRAPAMPFTALRAGDRARLAADPLLSEDGVTLAALGLSAHARFRVARAGDPWIVQVRATRIGLSDTVARGLRVILETATPEAG